MFGMSVLAVEYPGYGLARGLPSVHGVNVHVFAAYEYVTKVMNLPPDNVLVFGRSIGTGPACKLAAFRQVGGLILFAPFASLRALAKDSIEQVVPSFFSGVVGSVPVLAEWNNEEHLRRCTAPIVIIHGEQDETIPASHGRQCLNACDQSRAKGIFEGLWTHNHADLRPLVQPITDFLRQQNPRLLPEDYTIPSIIQSTRPAPPAAPVESSVRAQRMVAPHSHRSNPAAPERINSADPNESHMARSRRDQRLFVKMRPDRLEPTLSPDTRPERLEPRLSPDTSQARGSWDGSEASELHDRRASSRADPEESELVLAPPEPDSRSSATSDAGPAAGPSGRLVGPLPGALAGSRTIRSPGKELMDLWNGSWRESRRVLPKPKPAKPEAKDVVSLDVVDRFEADPQPPKPFRFTSYDVFPGLMSARQPPRFPREQ
jgi:hypothetical protein